MPDELHLTGSTRRLVLTKPLGPDVLLLTGFNGSESLSRPFSYRLDMISERADLDPAELLGQTVNWFVQLAEDRQRRFSGIIRQFVRGERWERGVYVYHAEVVPWLWLLSRTADCRIFQNKSVKDILQDVFGKDPKAAGAGGFDLSGIKGSHPKRDYCVQYRETDFNFVSRLMEEEGIFYYFRHTETGHTLIAGDGASAFYSCEDESIEFYSNDDLVQHISHWVPRNEFRSGKWTQRDYNFKHPARNLETSVTTRLGPADAKSYEIFDYPGGYYEKSDGETLTESRIEEEETPYEEIDGQSTCIYFSPGAEFTLAPNKTATEHSYTLVAVQHYASDSSQLAGQGGPFNYANSFVCSHITANPMFRAPRITPRPVVHGPQTALVVGPSGDEIYCDKYGRIKVQFHWDRYGKKDESSSCWIRVAQAMAGNAWGAVFTPRIGMEVVVVFLEGDPDRPLVVGTVYNGDNKTPWGELNEYKTRSGFKSRSTLHGGPANFNELMFQDKKGEEWVFFHAEKDMERSVEHDETIEVGHDQTITVKNNRTETVKEGNDTITLEQGNRVLTVKMGDRNTEVSLGKDTLEAMQQIVLKVGQSKITIDQTSITLEAMMINIHGTVMTDVKGDAILTLQGGLTTINT
jgi:type VI secretion system secreted protein VgrG